MLTKPILLKFCQSSVNKVAVCLYHLANEFNFFHERGYRNIGAPQVPMIQTSVQKEIFILTATTSLLLASMLTHQAR